MERKSPKHWANDLTRVLDACYRGDERFPVNVEQLACDYTKQICPDDPISLVQGKALKDFEGALFKAPKGEIGWGIFYNSDILSCGRIRFTLAHEFGHYLLHRQDHPDGIMCSPEDMRRWGSGYRRIEQEANDFAATLLMPLNDYRCRINELAKPNFEDIGTCAERYGVSLTAATLRWLLYTQRRAVLVVSVDGFVKWSRSSTPAWKTGLFIKTVDRDPVPVPQASLVLQEKGLDEGKGTMEHGGDIWLGEPCIEYTLATSRYDFVFSLLHFGDTPPRREDIEEEPEEDTFDRMTKALGSS